MSSFLSKVGSEYGAPIGRYTASPTDLLSPVKLHLRRVYLNQGGYDAGGAYWGIGAPLYQIEGENHDGDEIVKYTRAASRDAAKQWVKERLPNARFYR